jgi:hypothetical protein
MAEDNDDKENELPIADERIQKVKEVFERLEGEPGGTVSLDTNDDGNIDTIGVDVTGDGEMDTIVADTTHDGHLDVIVEDTTGDGDFDANLVTRKK